MLCECLSTLAALVHERQGITIHINPVKNFLVSLSLSVSLILPSFTLCHMSLRLETKPSIIVIQYFKLFLLRYIVYDTAQARNAFQCELLTYHPT